MDTTQTECDAVKKISKHTEVIKEGKAEILVAEKNVFYNPVQEFNRDLSIAVISFFSKIRYKTVLEKKDPKLKDNGINIEDINLQAGLRNEDGITVLEALSATGLRSIRYAKEIPGIKQITANDISAKAVDSIKKNIQHNEVEDLITASHDDATMLMYRSRRNRFDVVDLDPYGCPSIFLDSAVQCIADGGLLLVTATDMAVLAGNSPETCYVKYGAISLKSKACHEIALRILLQHISCHAGRYGRYIQPVLCISADFYIRVFVRVFSGQIKCKANTSKLGMIYQCVGCETMTIQPLGAIKPNGGYKLANGPVVDQLCKHCRHKHHIGGPIWLDPLHDQVFISKLLCTLDNMELGTLKRIQGVLNVVHEELDVPLYYTLDRLMSIVRCHTPTILAFRSALMNAGYKVSFSHANKVSIKTDAPNEVIWDIVRTWEKDHPAKREKLDENSPALAILTQECTKEISFDIHPLANPLSRQKHLTRFQENPTSFWGPGTRSTTMVQSDRSDSKKKRNQNKNSKKKLSAVTEKIEEINESDETVIEQGPPAKQAKQES
ncbi:probable tRNA (guanine(26)-N(2))-dimethyltransferase isoform X2 [Cephus cinctus]|nr:probable tRNA (guanine(26)-N(2))-dimethyltransferase isoform X2 [Cephus cinctus]XP_015604850.1 probable tRNA (guanine(26)-N(2))-dimethyltransferase isoform X2 [Cephus cinctus]XP_024945463.1 probable tRNA (guanine(26)-N(2))-dimethyltransferase isoform X2 [Cephus cinctus]